MLKTLLIAASTAALVLTPAYAGASKECTDEHMKQMDDMIAKMTDAAKKEELAFCRSVASATALEPIVGVA
jgi:hypothetical protein